MHNRVSYLQQVGGGATSVTGSAANNEIPVQESRVSTVFKG